MALLLLLMILLPGLARAGEPVRGKDGSARRVESFEPERVEVKGDRPERVKLSVSVLDPEGNPVEGLLVTDFRLLEAGVPQEIVDFGREFDREDRPLSVVLLFDRSRSIGLQMSKWRYAGLELLSILRPIDEIRLSTFTDSVEIEQDFTSDSNAIRAVVEQFGEQIRSIGGTRIYSSLAETFRDLRDRRGRKVVFLFTDGVIQGQSGVSPIATPVVNGLTHQAVEWQITVITILPGTSSAFAWLPVQSLAIDSGGWWLYSGDDLPDLIGRLGQRLLGSYYLAYDSVRSREDSRRRRLEVSLVDPANGDLQIRTVSGVWGDIPFIDMLAEDLVSDDVDVRIRAIAGLAVSDEPGATRPLRRALKDDSPGVRIAALGALAGRGDTAALKKIIRLMKDEDPEVRKAALDALGELYRVAEDEKTRTRILDALESAE